MRVVRAAVALALLCASCASGPNWVRADGSPGDPQQLKRDRMACFPTTSAVGPGSIGRDDAEDCMRNRGWRKR